MRDYAEVPVPDAAGLRRWLEVNHRQATPVWLVTAKKGQPDYLAYGDIVEELLCFGWVDSLPRAHDTTHTMLLASPRKAGSAWSKPNRDRIARLIASARMHEAGLAKVEAAKCDGSWDFLKAAEAGTEQPDLAAALSGHAQSRRGFNGFSAATRRRLIEWVERAKRPVTRAKRIAAIVADAAEGRDPLAWSPKASR